MNAKTCKAVRKQVGYRPSEHQDREYEFAAPPVEHLGVKPPPGYCVKAYEREEIGTDGLPYMKTVPYLAPVTWRSKQATPRRRYLDAKHLHAVTSRPEFWRGA